MGMPWSDFRGPGWGQTGQNTSAVHRVVFRHDLSCHRLEDAHSVDRFVFHESFQKMTLGQFECQVLLCFVTLCAQRQWFPRSSWGGSVSRSCLMKTMREKTVCWSCCEREPSWIGYCRNNLASPQSVVIVYAERFFCLRCILMYIVEDSQSRSGSPLVSFDLFLFL